MNIAAKLLKINQELASKGISLRIEQRRHLLNLRGPLPSRTQKETFKTQRISLRLPAQPEGIQEAQKMLEIVLFQLKHNQFNWGNWSKKQIKPKIQAQKAIQ